MALIERPKNVSISYFNEKGVLINESFNDLFTRIFLHEYEHLQGKHFQDNAIKKVPISKLQESYFYKNWHDEQEKRDLLL